MFAFSRSSEYLRIFWERDQGFLPDSTVLEEFRVWPVGPAHERLQLPRVALLCPTSARPLLEALGHLVREKHYCPMRIGSARQCDLKLKEKENHPYRCVLEVGPHLTEHRSHLRTI